MAMLEGHQKEGKKVRLHLVTITRIEEVSDSLLSQIGQCAQGAFGKVGVVSRERILDTFTDSRGRLFVYQDDAGKIYGFATSKSGTPREVLRWGNDDSIPTSDYVDVHGLFLSQAAVSPEAQGTGVYKKLAELRVREAIERSLPQIYVTTQNPRVAHGIASQLFKLKESGCIESVKATFIKGFSNDRQQIAQERQYSRSDFLNEKFRELDTKNGEIFLVLFKIVYPPK